MALNINETTVFVYKIQLLTAISLAKDNIAHLSSFKSSDFLSWIVMMFIKLINLIHFFSLVNLKEMM